MAADMDPEPDNKEPLLEHLADLPGEVWVNFILPKCKASELIRVKRVCRASCGLVDIALKGNTTLQHVISSERARRAEARETFRRVRRRDCLFNRNPPIVVAAMEGDMQGVKAQLDSGVAVDACGKWTETEEKMGGYDKSWDWSMDTALCMACGIGHLPLIQFLLDRGANPKHSACIECDVHHSAGQLARKYGHATCAEYMDRIIDAIEAPRRAAELQRAREASMQLRAKACLIREAGPPYIPSKPDHRESAGGVHPQYFASAALDFKYGLGFDQYKTIRPGKYPVSYMKEDEIAARKACGDLREPSGEEVSAKESASFAMLALEVLKTQPQFLPSTYGGSSGVIEEMLELLRATPERAPEHAAALAAVEAWEVHAVKAKEEQRIRIERDRAEADKKRQAKDEQLARRRALEVARCRRTNPSGCWLGHCENFKCGFTQKERDLCTWGHSDHDLPPHCRWGSTCRMGDRCRYNHMSYDAESELFL